MRAGERSWPRKLHSLTGLVPLGGFLAFHLYENSLAARGADAYNEAAHRLQQMPLALALEIGIIGAPILYHAVYGLLILAGRDGAATRLPPALLAVQRVSGVVVLAFVVFHLWTTRFVQLTDHEALDLYYLVRSTIANPWLYGFYIAGILCAALHLGIGLWTFGVTWGLAEGPKAERLMAFVSGVVFLVLSAVGVRSITSFRM